MGERRSFDWERIESDFRAGQSTVREIARQHDLTEGAIRKRAKRDGWARDLANKINVRAQRMALEAAVRTAGTHGAAPAYQVDEETIVAGAAQSKANVLIREQTAIADIGRLVDHLRAEIGALERDPDAFERLHDLVAIDLMASQPHPSGSDPQRAKKREARLAAFDRVVSLQGRLRMVADLIALEKTRVELESKVWALDADSAITSYPCGLDLFYPRPDRPEQAAPMNPDTPPLLN